MPLKVQIQIVAMAMEKMNRKSNGKAAKISFGKGVRADFLNERTLELRLEKYGKGQRKYMLVRANSTCGYLSW